MITTAELLAARSRLQGVIRHHAAEASATLSALCGRSVSSKPEHLQRTGSFKIRGAFNCISSLADAGVVTEVVAGSAGNHAQGVALAATLSGLASTIFMPGGVSLPKLEATRHYGATVQLGGTTVDDCIELARDHAAKMGAVYVPPFDDPLVIAGQGTIGLEIAEEAPDARVVVVPVGGGGLIAGVAAALKLTTPRVRIVGVEAAGAASMRAALEAGRPVTIDAVRTMADGIAVRAVSELTFQHVVEYVDEIITVSEEEISRAVLVLLERCKWVVEPAGAVAIAALLAGKVVGDDPAVALLSGGNVDPLLLRRLIEHGLSAVGRYVIIRVVMDDRPGSLARLTGAVAALDLNVLDVEHHRTGAEVGLDEVEVVLTVETRDTRHRDEIVAELCQLGFRASSLR